MNSEVFIKTHRVTWEKLNTILDRMAKNGPAGLTQDDLKALGPLFRRVTAHLAYAQTCYPEHEMVDYLNRLTVKAHGHIYKKETLGANRLKSFFGREFPSLVRIHWLSISLAGLILVMGLFLGFLLNHYQPALNGLVIPEHVQRSITEELARGQIGAQWSAGEKPAISTYIMFNNIQVGFSSFALGFTWGLGTVYILFLNGLMVGVLGAIFTAAGYALDFWTLILPHGALELLAIFICGGAGLTLAKALVMPGDYLRKDALMVQGKIAVKLVIGTIPMFVVAAIIEGFITPGSLPGSVKLSVGAITLILFFFYIFLGNAKTDDSGQEAE
jgi:uncharacterized membrane protein SpoIIM required for sporulation